MSFNKISSTPYFHVAGILVVGGLTLGTIIPTNTWFSELLSSHALLIMLFFLISGFIGFAWRKNTVILFNFIACIAVCSFLKEQQPTTTNQAGLSEKEPTVRVASLTLRQNSDLVVLQEHLGDRGVDFLSLNVAPAVDFPAAVLENLKERLPYYQVIHTEKENSTFVFSSYEMESLDTFHYTRNHSISFVGTLSMSKGKAVPFISTNIPVADYELPEAQQHWVELSQYMTHRYEIDPTMTSKNAHLTTWQPAVQALCSAKDLSVKSEYRLGLQQPEHLFYAENLICKQVEDLLEGYGAVATYEFVGVSSTKNNFKGALRGGGASL
ncbi:MAG: hypothetical protein ACRBFS_05475 [Aureispira sp.]